MFNLVSDELIEYRSGELFNNITGKKLVFVHSCNSVGKWGAGVAKEYAARYPAAYQEYQKYCSEDATLGRALLTEERGDGVGSLIVSSGYGSRVDPEDMILAATRKALEDLFSKMGPVGGIIYSPQINSGLFRVPWEKTEKVLKDVLSFNTQIKWVVKYLI